jgi:chaperonin GroES
MRLLHNKVLVKKNPVQEKSIGGIIIPGNIDARSVVGTVVAVGFGHLISTGEIRPLAVKIGDVVQFRTGAGAEIEVEREKYMLLLDHEIDVILGN